MCQYNTSYIFANTIAHLSFIVILDSTISISIYFVLLFIDIACQTTVPACSNSDKIPWHFLISLSALLLFCANTLLVCIRGVC